MSETTVDKLTIKTHDVVRITLEGLSKAFFDKSTSDLPHLPQPVFIQRVSINLKWNIGLKGCILLAILNRKTISKQKLTKLSIIIKNQLL